MTKLLTAQELAEILNLSVETVWRYTRQKKIPTVELGEKQFIMSCSRRPGRPVGPS
jgi:excisionase family DNA binding protein